MKTVWVVTYPSKESTVGDILFFADAKRLKLQFDGGLDPEEVADFFLEYEPALEFAQELLMEGK